MTQSLSEFYAANEKVTGAPPATSLSSLPQIKTYGASQGLGSGMSTIIAQEGADHLKPVIEAIYKQESGAGSNARTSIDGAQGGMQVIPATFQRYAKPGERIDDPSDNMRVGVRIIKDLANRFGNDPAKIATGYFSGEGNVNPGQGNAWRNDRADGNGKRVSGYVSDILSKVGGIGTTNTGEIPVLPDLSKQPKWPVIEAGDRFQKLTDAEKKALKGKYFDELIAPHAAAEGYDVPAERQKFMAQNHAPKNIDARSTFEKVGDTARNLGAGALKIGPTALKSAADIANMLTGDTVDLGVSKAMESGMNAIDETVASKRFNDQKKGLKAMMADKSKGIGDMFAYMLDNPAILVDKTITTIGSMFLPAGAAKGAVTVANLLGKGTAAASKAAVATSIGTAAAQNAADTFSTLDKQSLGDRYKGAAISAGVSILTGLATGGGAEGQIAKKMAGDLQSGKIGLDTVKRFLQSVGKEGTQEAGEELGNITGEAVGSHEAPNLTNAAKRMAFAGTLGAVMGGGTHVATSLGGSNQTDAQQQLADTTAATVAQDAQINQAVNGLQAQSIKVHPTTQTADSIVRELATESGVPLETVLPTAPTADDEIRAAQLWVNSSDGSITPNEQIELNKLQQAMATNAHAPVVMPSSQLQHPQQNNNAALNAETIVQPEVGQNQQLPVAGQYEQQPIIQNIAAPVPTANVDTNQQVDSGIAVTQSPQPEQEASALRAPQQKEISNATQTSEAQQAETQESEWEQASTNTIEQVAPKTEREARERRRKTDILTPDGKKVAAQWDVVEADSIKASLKEGVSQPRDRTRAASNAQILEIAGKPDFERLSDTSKTMDYGAPTLSNDGLIVGGNGRFEGISRAYEGATAAAYRNDVEKYAARFGLDTEAIRSMKKPVLVRRIMDNTDTRKLAIQSNQAPGLQMSDMEQAALDAERMRGLEQIEISDTGDIPLTSRNMGAIKQTLAGYSTNELAGMMAANGGLSQSGLRRLRNAILFSAYGKSDTLARLIESPDADMKNVGTALVRAAGKLSTVRTGIADGGIPNEFDISSDLTAAVETLSGLRAEGKRLDEFLAQGDMFGGGLSPSERVIIQFLADNLRSAKTITEGLANYADRVLSTKNNSGGLFDDTPMPTKTEVLNNATKRITNERTANFQQSILNQATPELHTNTTGSNREVQARESWNRPDTNRQSSDEVARKSENRTDTKASNQSAKQNDVNYASTDDVKAFSRSVPDDVFGISSVSAPSVKQVENIYKQLTDGMKNAPLGKFVQSTSDLPFDAPSDVKGVFWRGSIYLVADNLGPVVHGGNEVIDASVIRETIAHEMIGHYGLRGFFGASLDSVLNRIHTNNLRVQKIAYLWKQKNQELITEWKEKYNVTDSWVKARSIEEALATMAEKGEKLKGWKSLAASLQILLRKMGATKWANSLEAKTDAEALLALKQAEMFVKRGVTSATPIPDAAYPLFARANIQQPLGLTGGQNTPAWDTPPPSRLDDFIYEAQDKHINLKSVQKAIAKTTTIIEQFDAYQKEELYHGRVAARTRKFLEREMRPLLMDMKLKGIAPDALESYLWARHAKERNAQIAKINPKLPDGGSGLTDAQVNQYMAGNDVLDNNGDVIIKGLNQADINRLDALAARVDAINDGTAQILLQYGLETPATIAAWKAAYKYYVPLHRADMEGVTPIGSGYSIKGTASKRAMGSQRKVVDILAHLALQREAAITRGEKNRVGLALYGLALQNKNDDFWGTDKVPMIQRIDKSTGLVTTVPDPTYKSRDNVLMVRIGGQDRAVVFNERNERAMKTVTSLKNLDANQLGSIESFINKFTRYFASINTQYNPIFGLMNGLRDVQAATLNLSSTALAGHQGKVLAAIPSAMRAIWQMERDGKSNHAYANIYDDLQMAGGTTGYREIFRMGEDRAKALQQEFDAMDAGNTRKAMNSTLKFLDNYNTAIENATRLAVYKVAIEQGLSKDKAASIAKNLTVNFNRKGRIGTQANTLFAFFNASVQGTARTVETLRGPAGKKIILGGIALGVVQALVMSAAGMDDDEPNDFIKARNFIIPIGDGDYLRIPMPLGFNILPGLGRIMTEAFLSGGKNMGTRATDLLSLIADNANPIGGGTWSQMITPTIFDPIVALGQNADFTGKKIFKEDLNPQKPTPGYTRARDTSSHMARGIAKGVNYISGGTAYTAGYWSPTPDQIDYIFGVLTGGVGREINKLYQTSELAMRGEATPTRRIPVVSAFYGTTTDDAAVSSKYWNNIKDLNAIELEIKGRIKNGEDTADFIQQHPEVNILRPANRLEGQISKMRKERHRIEFEEKMMEQERTEKLKKVDEDIVNAMRSFNTMTANAKKRNHE